MKRFWKFSKIEERDKTVGYRNDWMSFYPGFKKWNFTIAPASYFDNRFYISFCILWGQFYIHIPFIRSKYDECDPPRYGWYFYSVGGWIPTTFVVCYGKKTKHYHMPWELDWVRTSILLKDGTWANETKGNRQDFWKEEWKEKKWKEVHPYMYTLKNGTTQHRMATITVDEREWRPRWFKWTGLFKKIRTTIDVSFDDEVGERSGSWKGGTLGCGYNILPKETPLQCLRRMERERIFN